LQVAGSFYFRRSRKLKTQEIEAQKSITMKNFLKNYCNIENNEIIDKLSSLSHKDLKIVASVIYNINLVSLPFDIVNKENINRGNIILVRDTNHNLAPYKNPLQNVEYFSPKKIETQEMDYEEIIDLIEENLTIEDVDISSVGSFNIPHR
jgi:hypothetical protein